MSNLKNTVEHLAAAFDGCVDPVLLDAIKHALIAAYYKGQAEGVAWASESMEKIDITAPETDTHVQ